ncbi:MAG TPA: polynucleotide adenylyltransferase PcnB [Burkholderiales bacterium]|nr:polynucleotide adenylyltransferase PcnB [Burkholderiales bacterium]
MIRKLLRRILPRRTSRDPALEPLAIPKSEHGVARESISRCARKVTSSLQAEGFSAFVVGGAVRDLLFGLEPKDFDVATDATPEQVRAVFRRSRIIGRRFRLVHVMCGDEVVEVSTFRAKHLVAEGEEAATDQHGRVLRDNVFGTQAEDATRRDFTINALFYDPSTETILDYCSGLADLEAKRLRMIGDPESRYREDPVRLLRAVRLAAKLGLKIEAHTRAPIRRLAPLLKNVPAARVFEEMLKLLLSGHSAKCVRQLREEGLHHGLLPMLDVILEQPLGERFVMLALERTDERVRRDKPVSPGFLFAALLWHEVLAAWKQAEQEGLNPMPALFRAMDEVLDEQSENLAIPRRFGADMKEIWALQPRLLNRSGRRPYVLLGNPRFRAAFDFLLLRCDSGEVDPEIGQWWTRFQDASEEERAGMLLPAAAGSGRRRRRRRRKGAKGQGTPAPENA